MATRARKAESAPPLKATTTGPGARRPEPVEVGRSPRTGVPAAGPTARSVTAERHPAGDDWARTSSTAATMPVYEGAELGVAGRGLVEAHLVDAVLQVVGVDAEQGDAPLPVVEAGGAGDELQDPTVERRPTAPWPFISASRSS